MDSVYMGILVKITLKESTTVCFYSVCVTFTIFVDAFSQQEVSEVRFSFDEDKISSCNYLNFPVIIAIHTHFTAKTHEKEENI